MPPPLSPTDPPPEPFGWTRPQRLALGSLLLLLLLFLGFQLFHRPASLDDPLVIVRGQPLHLAAAIDPNTASLQDLSRVPHLGEKLAANIIAYRDARKPLTPDAIVFHHPEDLDPIPGIGKSLITQITPYLTFPEDPPEPAATEPH